MKKNTQETLEEHLYVNGTGLIYSFTERLLSSELVARELRKYGELFKKEADNSQVDSIEFIQGYRDLGDMLIKGADKINANPSKALEIEESILTRLAEGVDSLTKKYQQKNKLSLDAKEILSMFKRTRTRGC